MSEIKPGLIFEAILAIMADVPAIAKERQGHNYTFRGIEDMYNVIHPLMVKHGVFCAPRVLERQLNELVGKEGKPVARALLTVSHRFYAKDGSFIEVVTAGEGLDTGDKASNKAMSNAMKYAFIELYSLPTVDIADSDLDQQIEGGTAAEHKITSVTTVGKSNTFGF